MKGGHAVAAALKTEGIDQVFGIVDTHDSPLFDGVFGNEAIRVISVRRAQRFRPA